MSVLVAAAAMLSCGLSAAPDGTPVPAGTVPMINAPIPDDFAASLATRIAPEPEMRFTGEPIASPEWTLGLNRESDTRFMVARLSPGLLAYDIRIGWVEAMPDGSNTFSETSRGTCRVTEAAGVPAGETQ